MKILFCNIGWMKHYQGQTDNDLLIGGGRYVDQNGYGGEVANFYPIDEYCYGYVHVKSMYLDLEKIAKSKAKNDNFIRDVCIVWIARKPKQQRVIVGWYNNAEVYREPQPFPDKEKWSLEIPGYWFKANKNDCVLIPEKERNFIYPRGKGFISTARYTYVSPSAQKYTINEINKIESYVERVKNFINNYGKLPQKSIALVLEEDLVEIEYGEINSTTKTQLVEARLGQGKFRKNLLNLYPKCPVTGVELKVLLKASHIKPWRDSNNTERLDKFNGFMLAAHVDALFDNGYISFDDDGSLLISYLCKNDLNKLNIGTKTKININDENKKYLKWHRDNIFKKKN